MRKVYYSSGRWHQKDGQIYSEETGKTILIVSHFDKNDIEQNANFKLCLKAPEMSEALLDQLRIMELSPTHTNQYQRNKIRELLTDAGIQILF